MVGKFTIILPLHSQQLWRHWRLLHK